MRAVNLVTNAITVSPQTSNTSARVQPLESTTTYRIEVRAINTAGVGTFPWVVIGSTQTKTLDGGGQPTM